MSKAEENIFSSCQISSLSIAGVKVLIPGLDSMGSCSVCSAINSSALAGFLGKLSGIPTIKVPLPDKLDTYHLNFPKLY